MMMSCMRVQSSQSTTHTLVYIDRSPLSPVSVRCSTNIWYSLCMNIKYLHGIADSEQPCKHSGVAINGQDPKHPAQSQQGKEDYSCLQGSSVGKWKSTLDQFVPTYLEICDQYHNVFSIQYFDSLLSPSFSTNLYDKVSFHVHIVT